MISRSSHFVEADGLHWHVEEMGQGPVILLVHGTAASVHSWRNVMPLLAGEYHVVALDLPGHGETRIRDSSDYTLERMARGVACVITAMKLGPETVVGHSAGAAILAEACARKQMLPQNYISFNGAFYPFGGAASGLIAPFVKALAFAPFLPPLLAGLASRSKVEKIMRGTGYNISPEGIDLYFRLFKQPSHVAAALGMMGSWDLRGMENSLARLTQTCVFVGGANDKAVPPETADRAAACCRNAKVVHIKGLGHLLHEENPELAAQIIKGEYR